MYEAAALMQAAENFDNIKKETIEYSLWIQHS
jgi:hypothetical protein